jgi:hypothetical protein
VIDPFAPDAFERLWALARRLACEFTDAAP